MLGFIGLILHGRLQTFLQKPSFDTSKLLTFSSIHARSQKNPRGNIKSSNSMFSYHSSVLRDDLKINDVSSTNWSTIKHDSAEIGVP